MMNATWQIEKLKEELARETERAETALGEKDALEIVLTATRDRAQQLEAQCAAYRNRLEIVANHPALRKTPVTLSFIHTELESDAGRDFAQRIRAEALEEAHRIVSGALDELTTQQLLARGGTISEKWFAAVEKVRALAESKDTRSFFDEVMQDPEFRKEHEAAVKEEKRLMSTPNTEGGGE